MKKLNILIFTLIFLTSTYQLIGQSSGILTYSAALDLKYMQQANALNQNIDQKTKMFLFDKIINSSPELTFELKFNDGLSEFKCINLPEKTAYVDLTVSNTGAKKIYYFDKQNNIKGYKTETFSEYLVQPELTEWSMHDEEKIINGYHCKKATIESKSYGRSGEIIDEFVVWYTEDIPLEFGIKGFEGLPGVIVELSCTKNIGNGHYKFILKSVELNKEFVKIKLPKNELISEKASQEMFAKLIRNLRNRKTKAK